MKQDSSSGYRAFRSSAAVFTRGATGHVELRGADRRPYLQGLLTNDISALAPATGCYAAMLNAQGRMITDMRVLELGDRILLAVPRELATGVCGHLDRFVFSEDVQVSEVSSTIDALGLYGPRATEILGSAAQVGKLPSELFASMPAAIAGADVLIVRADDFGNGFDLMMAPADADRVRAGLQQAGAAAATPEDAEIVRVEAGRPLFGRDMDTDTIPLEAGIEDRAISRTKGCYVGQEVIVRVLDRGHGRVAKRLVGLRLDRGGEVPASGSAVTVGDRNVGRVTSAVLSPLLERPLALGYVQRDHAAAGTVVGVAGQPALVSELPFQL